MKASSQRLKIILDSNIIISSSDGERLDEVFSVSHDLFLSQAMFEMELLNYSEEIKRKVSEGRLTLLDGDDNIYKKYDDLKEKYGENEGMSFCDMMALATAIIRQLGHIATADGQLRRAAKREGVMPLWILDLIGFLIEEGKMTKDEARIFYDNAFPRRKSSFEKMIHEQLTA